MLKFSVPLSSRESPYLKNGQLFRLKHLIFLFTIKKSFPKKYQTVTNQKTYEHEWTNNTLLLF